MALDSSLFNDDFRSSVTIEDHVPLNGKEVADHRTDRSIQIFDLNKLCQTFLEKDEDILAFGIIDLTTGILLGVHHLIPHFDAYLDIAAATVVQFFRGREVQQIESSLAPHHESEVKDTMEEIFLNTTRIYMFMKIVPGQDAAAVQVVKKTANQALGWISLRNAIPKVEKALLASQGATPN